MASITIRNLDDDVKKRLRKQAAEHGRSLEAEARAILTTNVHASPATPPESALDLFQGIREIVEKYGGVELEVPPRTPMRPVDFFEDAREFRRETRPQRRPKRRK